MPLTIRPARVEDADLLTDLVLRSKQSNGYDDAFMAACVAELAVTPQVLEEEQYWVAEDDGLAGCAALLTDPSGKSGEVTAFFTDPARKRQGIGRKLWERFADAARSAGVKTLRLDADPAAVPFYQAIGFEVVGEVPSGSIPGRSLPHMTRTL